MELRKAQPGDAKLLFDWKNEEECRKNSLCDKTVTWEEHSAWLESRLESETTLLYIATENGVPVGQIRLDLNHENAVISYSVDKAFRGRGYGRKLLACAEQKVREYLPGKGIAVLEGIVKADNKASVHCFSELGYEQRKESSGLLRFWKTL